MICYFWHFFADDSELDSDLASDDDNEDSDNIDYFADVPSDNEEGEGGPTGAGGTKRAHYGDFFDAPEDEEKIIDRPLKVKQKDRQEKKMETAAVEEKEGEREEREEGESHDSDGEEDSSDDDGRELSELSGDEEIEGEGSTGESGAEEEEEREVEGEEDSEEENPKTLSSHEKKQLKVSYATLSC